MKLKENQKEKLTQTLDKIYQLKKHCLISLKKMFLHY